MPTENYTSKFRVDVSDLKKGITEANNSIKKATAEFKNATAGMKDWERSADGLTAKIKQQEKVVEEERKKLDLLKEQLTRVNKAQEDGRKVITDLNGKYDDAVKKYGATSEEAKKYAAELSKAEAAQERNRKAAEKLELQIINQDTAVKKATAEISDYQSKLNALETEQKQDKKAGDDLNNAIEDTGKQAQKTTDGGLNAFTVALGNLAANVITSVINKLGELGKAAVDCFEEFDKGADAVIKATGATGEQAAELQKSYANVSKSIIGDSEDMGKALGEVNTRFGLTGDELESTTTNFLKFAEITGGDATTAIRNVSRAIESAGLETSDYSTILDQLAKAAQVSGISADTLSERLTTYGAQMRAAGYDTADTIAMLASWEKQGVNTETAITGIRKALANWGKDGKDAKNELAGLVEQIKNAPDDTAAAALALENFGNKAGTELSEVIRSGRFEFEEFTDVIANSEGVVSNTFDETMDGFDKLKLAAQGLKVSAGEFVSGIVDKISPDIDNLLSAFNGLIAGEAGAADALAESLGNIVVNLTTTLTSFIPKAVYIGSKLIDSIFTGIVTALPDIINGVKQGVLSLIRTIGALIPSIIDTVLDVLPAINEAIFGALPQILNGVIEVITLLVNKMPPILKKALATAPKVWKAIADALINALPMLTGALQNLMQALIDNIPIITPILEEGLTTIINEVTALFSEFAPLLQQGLITLLTIMLEATPQLITLLNDSINVIMPAVMQAIMDNLPLVFETIKKLSEMSLKAIPPVLKATWEIIKALVKEGFDNLKKNAADAWEGIKSVFSKVADFFGDTFSTAWERVKAVFSTGGKIFDGIKDGIVSAFTATVNAIIRGINKVVTVPFEGINDTLEKLQNIEILGISPFENLGRISIPQIPELEYGGILKRGQLGLLEGKNDEAVIPLQNNMEGMKRIAGLLADEMGGGRIGGETVNNYTFTQTNNSPKYLSRWDIYRQTRNLMNALKGV